MNNIDRESIIEGLLRIIKILSDIEHQKRTWIRGEGPGVDFTETVCLFFDLADPVLDKYTEFNFTDNQYRLLKEFRDEFNAFCDTPESNDPPIDFISTPKWEKIRDLAKEVLNAFEYHQQK